MKEIQGKSFLVQVSAWFELARVQVIGSRLYLVTDLLSLIETVDVPLVRSLAHTQPTNPA